MKPLLFTGVFRNDPFEQAAKAAAGIGYSGLEIRALSHLPADSTQQHVREMKSILDAYCLEAPAIYLPGGKYLRNTEAELSRQLDQIKRYTEWAAELGVTMIVHNPSSPPPAKATEQDFDVCALWMSRVADVLAQANLTLIWEIHFNNIFETIDSCLKMLSKTDRSNAGFALDPGNMAICGEEYGANAVERLGQTIRHVHAKDIAFFAEKLADRQTGEYNSRHYAVELMGKGEVDHRPAYRALLDRGYGGYVTLEAQVAGVTPEEIARHEYLAFVQDVKS